MRALLDEGVDANAARADGVTALLWAAHWNDVETSELLLHAGADVDAAEDQGLTPLLAACENGSVAMVATLLSAGANAATPQANGVTPLMMAARTGSLDIVRTLVARGADAAVVIPSTGQTALMWATAEGHVEVMGALIAAGADIHTPSSIGFTPLLFAVRNGDIEATAALLAAGADVNAPGSDATHALPLAVVSGHDALARILLDRGADPNSTMAGVPALHAAVASVDKWLRDWLRARRVSVFVEGTAGLAPSNRLALMAGVPALHAAVASVDSRRGPVAMGAAIGRTGEAGQSPIESLKATNQEEGCMEYSHKLARSTTDTLEKRSTSGCATGCVPVESRCSSRVPPGSLRAIDWPWSRRCSSTAPTPIRGSRPLRRSRRTR